MKWYNKLGKFFAIIFSVIYSIILTLMIILFFMSSFTKGNIYTDILKSIDLNSVKLSDIDPRLADMFGSDVTLEDAFVSSLGKAGIDENIAREIANNEEIKEVVGDFVGDCINYSINKEELPQIKEEDVNVILDNIDVEEVTGEKIEKQEIMDYVDEVNKNAKDYLMEGLNYANGIN